MGLIPPLLAAGFRLLDPHIRLPFLRAGAVNHAALIIVTFLSALLITYLIGIEEKELQDRYGQAYLAYKQRPHL